MFQLLTSALAAAAADRQREEFDRVQHIRDRALELTTLGQKIKQQQVVIDAFTANPTRENAARATHRRRKTSKCAKRC